MGMEKMTKNSGVLLEAAKHAAMWGRSYSGMRVGAAVMTSEGQLYRGANLSNASPALTVCAERAAVQQASMDGARTIIEAAVYSPDVEMISPCGLCRQVLIELAQSADMLVWMGGFLPETSARWESHTIGELLPYAYVSRRQRIT